MSRTTKLTEWELKTIVQYIAESNGVSLAEATKYGLSYHMRDEYGWTSSPDTPVIMWEEGPYSWVHDLSEDTRLLAEDLGFFIEPVNSWMVAIHLL